MERNVARIIDAMLEKPRRTRSAGDFQTIIDTDFGKAREAIRRANLPTVIDLLIEVFSNELQVAKVLQSLRAAAVETAS